MPDDAYDEGDEDDGQEDPDSNGQVQHELRLCHPERWWGLSEKIKYHRVVFSLFLSFFLCLLVLCIDPIETSGKL